MTELKLRNCALCFFKLTSATVTDIVTALQELTTDLLEGLVMMSSLAPARKGRSFLSHARNERLFFHQFFMLASVLTIFSVDISTDSEISISALYVVVVLFSARLYAKQHVILISATCIVLTLLSCTLNRRGEVNMGILNSAIGALLIGITSYLVLRIEAAKHATRILTEANRLRDALIGSWVALPFLPTAPRSPKLHNSRLLRTVFAMKRQGSTAICRTSSMQPGLQAMDCLPGATGRTQTTLSPVPSNAAVRALPNIRSM
jgi:hypothetical protein